MWLTLTTLWKLYFVYPQSSTWQGLISSNKLYLVEPATLVRVGSISSFCSLVSLKIVRTPKEHWPKWVPSIDFFFYIGNKKSEKFIIKKINNKSVTCQYKQYFFSVKLLNFPKQKKNSEGTCPLTTGFFCQLLHQLVAISQTM